MLNWITSRGWKVEIKPGRIFVTKGQSTGDYSTIKAAYFALGGPKVSYVHNPKCLKP